MMVRRVGSGHEEARREQEGQRVVGSRTGGKPGNTTNSEVTTAGRGGCGEGTVARRITTGRGPGKTASAWVKTAGRGGDGEGTMACRITTGSDADWVWRVTMRMKRPAEKAVRDKVGKDRTVQDRNWTGRGSGNKVGRQTTFRSREITDITVLKQTFEKKATQPNGLMSAFVRRDLQ